MSNFVVTGSGLLDLRNTDIIGFTGIEFQTNGDLRIQLKTSQFEGFNGLLTDSSFVGSGFTDTVEVILDDGSTFVGSSFTVSVESFIFRDSIFNENITGTQTNDRFYITGGVDAVDGNIGTTDTLILDWSFLTTGVNTTGSGFSDFSGTSISVSNIDRYDMTLGSGNDNVTTGAGYDILRGGGGNDQLNTGKGRAVVEGGVGFDLWTADFSDDPGPKIIDLSVSSTQNAGGGSTYNSIERLNVTGGMGADVFLSRATNPSDGLNDTLNGGGGSDILKVGGGIDVANGGSGNDLLIIDYSTDTNSFVMAGGNAQITDFTNTNITFSSIERFDVTFGSGNDTILLGAGSDKASGGGGNDSLNTAAGAAIVDGGDGADIWISDFSGDASVKTIDLNLAGLQAAGNGTTYVNIERLGFTGGSGNDVITTRTDNANDGFNDTLNGGGGSDVLKVGGGSDVANGGNGSDLLIVDYSTDTNSFVMAGGNAQFTDFSNTNVTFTGIERFDVTFGSGNDTILLGAGSDKASGGGGNDSLNTAAGAAIVDGGGGTDIWISDFSGDASVKTIDLNLAGLQAAGNGTTYVNIERLGFTGGSGNDVIATRTDNSNDGLNDTLNGGGGSDILKVGGGSDVANGGSGNDLLIVDYSTDTNSFVMAAGNAQFTDFSNTNVTFTGIERFDVTFGSGNDTILLGAGSDRARGGAGNDSLNTAAGAAVVDGGSGTDLWTADFSADTAAKSINLNIAGVHSAGGGTSYVRIERLGFTGGSGNDVIVTRTGNPNDGYNDTLNGGDGNDSLTVGGGSDTVNGGAGTNDLLIVDYSTDTGNFSMAAGNTQFTDFSNTNVTFSNIERFDVKLGSGIDAIILGAGNDRLQGGASGDTLTGGGGADRFIYTAVNDSVAGPVPHDTILDFSESDDRLDFRAIDALAGGADDAFSFIGSAAFSAAGQIRVYDNGVNTFVEVNTGGTLDAEMLIQLSGIHALDLTDLIL